MIIGLDVGGTYTDVVLLSSKGIEKKVKVPTDPSNLFNSVLSGFTQILGTTDPSAIKRVVISTYQSITGTGVKAVEQMNNERKDITADMAYPYPIDKNCLPHCDVFEENGYTKEEMKLTNETKKILDPAINVTATAVRVPVVGGHSEAVNIEFENDFEVFELTEEESGEKTTWGGLPSTEMGGKKMYKIGKKIENIAINFFFSASDCCFLLSIFIFTPIQFLK